MSWDFVDASKKYLDAGLPTFLDNRSLFTVHAWSKRRADPGSHYILAQENTVTNAQMVRLYFDDFDESIFDRMLFGVNAGGNTGKVGSVQSQAPLGVWQSIAGDWDTSRNPIFRLFVDGVLNNTNHPTNQVGASLGVANESLRIGSRVGTNSYWEGFIGRLAFWSVILTDAEHQALADGFPFTMIRPESLLWGTFMDSKTGTEFWVNYVTRTTGNFTHVAAPVASNDNPRILGTEPPQEGGVRPEGVEPVTGWGDWQSLAAVPHPTTSHDDRNVQKGVEYQYRVKAADNVGNQSDWSNLATALVVPGEPGPRPIPPKPPVKRRWPWYYRRRGRGLLDI